MMESEFRNSLFLAGTHDVGTKLEGRIELGDRLVPLNGKLVREMDEIGKWLRMATASR
jgi:hypothetical protein